MDREAEVISYIVETVNTDVWSLTDLMSEAERAPFPLNRYMKLYCGNLEELLQNYEDEFFVENGRVTVYDEVWERGRENAIRYFEDQLNDYPERPHYMNFRGHIGQADDEAIDFINCFYPKEDFKKFLLAHPDVFVVFNDDTVFLIENEAVNYFEKCLENDREGLHFMNLRGCIGQAPKHVIQFINQYYHEERFLEFLENNSDVFYIEEGYVYLMEKEP